MRVFWIVFIVGCGFQSPPGAPDEMSPDADTTNPGTGSGPLQCSASYNLPGLTGPSHYRLIKPGHPAWEQSNDCNDDQPGLTHLVVIETLQELADVKKFITNPGPGLDMDAIWIGGVQPKNAASPSDGWLGFDGAPLINGWGGTEPNDNGGDESNHQEQFVLMAKTAPFFIDIAGTTMAGALCECDGKPIEAGVATLVASYH